MATPASGWYGSGQRQLRRLDFPGFGPHSLRRAKITWRQEVGGSSIETSTSKIAGHANTKVTKGLQVVKKEDAA